MNKIAPQSSENMVRNIKLMIGQNDLSGLKSFFKNHNVSNEMTPSSFEYNSIFYSVMETDNLEIFKFLLKNIKYSKSNSTNIKSILRDHLFYAIEQKSIKILKHCIPHISALENQNHELESACIFSDFAEGLKEVIKTFNSHDFMTVHALTKFSLNSENQSSEMYDYICSFFKNKSELNEQLDKIINTMKFRKDGSETDLEKFMQMVQKQNLKQKMNQTFNNKVNP